MQVKVKVLGCRHSSDVGQAVHPGQLLSSLGLDQVLSASFLTTSPHLLHGNNINYFVAFLKFKEGTWHTGIEQQQAKKTGSKRLTLLSPTVVPSGFLLKAQNRTAA